MLEIEIIKEEEERRISYFVVNEEDMDNPHKLESTKKLFEYLKNNVNQHHFNIIQYILDGIPFVVKEALRKKNERFESYKRTDRRGTESGCSGLELRKDKERRPASPFPFANQPIQRARLPHAVQRFAGRRN